MDILRHVDFPIGPLYATLLLGFITVVLLYWYSSQKQRFWEKRGVPFIKPPPFIGLILGNALKPFHVADVDGLKKCGRIYGHYEGTKPMLTVGEPELIRDILAKDVHVFSGRRTLDTGDKMVENGLTVLRGESWKRVRKILAPTFSMGKIKKIIGIFNDCSKTLLKNLREASEKGEPVETKSLYGAFTMDTIACAAFSTKIDSHNDPNNSFVTAANQIFHNPYNWRIFFFALFPGITKFFQISIFPPKSTNFFVDTISRIIEERKRTGQTKNDFLQLLLDTTKEAAEDDKLDANEENEIVENYGKLDSGKIFEGYVAKKTLSNDELVAQCILFFLGGYENTSSTLSFASYALALHPDIQERAIQEVDEVLKANNGEFTYEAIRTMKYLDNVIAETLRYYPPFVRLERRADEDYKLGDTGFIVPKGVFVTIPVYVLHRDPKFFPNPDKFDPDRFLPEERAKLVPYTYLPFGGGPRNCIAMRFSLMEVKVCLANVLSNFRIKKCSKTEIPLKHGHGFGFLHTKSIFLSMEIRKDSVRPML